MKLYVLLVVKRGRAELHGVYRTAVEAREEQRSAEATVGRFHGWKWLIEEYQLGHRPSLLWQQELEALRTEQRAHAAEWRRKSREAAAASRS